MAHRRDVGFVSRVKSEAAFDWLWCARTLGTVSVGAGLLCGLALFYYPRPQGPGYRLWVLVTEGASLCA